MDRRGIIALPVRKVTSDHGSFWRDGLTTRDSKEQL